MYCIPKYCTLLFAQQLQMPSTPAEWESIARVNEQRWNFPLCLGSLDGKHVRLKKPKNEHSRFICYKQFHSIVLLVVADGDYNIVMCDAGKNGRISDGGVLQASSFGKKLDAGQL